MVFLKDFFEKVDFKKKSADDKNDEKLPSTQRVYVYLKEGCSGQYHTCSKLILDFSGQSSGFSPSCFYISFALGLELAIDPPPPQGEFCTL